jgi:hypothetical protein
MDLSFALTALTFIMLIGVWALYWTTWKIRNDLIEGRQKLDSELDEIRKALGSKTDKA